MFQKKSMFLKGITLILALSLALSLMTSFALAEDAGEPYFTQWNEDAPALNALIDYVESVTDESSPDFIPEVDRIAVFDMDGTLMGELYPTYLEYYLLARRILVDESYQPDAEMLEFGRMLRDNVLTGTLPDHMDMKHALHAAKAYAGLTLNEFADFVTRQLVREVDGFEGMTYATAYYLPMAEVIEYLTDNGFKCYVCSGSDRFICRVFMEGMVDDIPYEQIIGMDVQLEATNQGDADGLDYVFTPGDDLVRTDKLLIKNLKTNKVLQIAQEIGRQPVLSFGNSSGDVSMHNYVIHNNIYKSAAFMLIADDEVRDYGNAEKAAGLREKWEASGYHVISMANDWKTIYGEDVVKTGEFHWLEELAENRVPVDAAAEEVVTEAEPEGVTEPAADTGSVQYVMYLGTNDKDTNKPVFTQAEALEKAKEILLKHFGGYTIQEANGGWVDGETEYQEYTLVIYLSDTTQDAVHAAADEMIATFNQSSVLIQANPTTTEFYSTQAGIAGSNIALKDNAEEAEYQIKVAMQYLLEESWGEKVNDARIYVEKIYTAEEEQKDDLLKMLNLGMDEVAFIVRYELHPAEGVDINEFLAGNGEYDEESGWVKEKTAVGILRPNAEGEPTYIITDFGTGF